MKKMIIWAVVILIVVAAGIMLFNSDDNIETTDSGQEQIVTQEQNAGYAVLETDEDVFKAIDESVEFLD